MKKKKAKVIFSGIFVLLATIIVIFLHLFTNLLGEPKYIYLDEGLGKSYGRFYNIKKVSEIILWNTKNNFTLNKIKYCENLETIYLLDQGAEFKINLEYNSKLSKVVVTGEYLDWSWLKSCITINTLEIEQSNFNDLSILENMSHLTNLSIFTTDDIDVSHISNLSGLCSISISLSQKNSINITELSELKNIRCLELAHSPLINFNDICNFTNLEKIRLYDININDFSPLLDIPNLKTLKIGETEVPQEILDKLEEKGVEVIVLDE